MRLSKGTRQLIVESVHHYFSDSAQVWLFGSRCDDSKSGGDIDLYLEDQDIDEPVYKRILLKIALQDKLGMQKIDLVYHDRRLPLQPIHLIAKEEGILLN